MKKCICFILCMVIWFLTACAAAPDSGNSTPPEIYTELSAPVDEVKTLVLVSSDYLKIERTGNQTIIYDIAGDRIHTLTTRKIARRKTAPKPSSNVLVDTDTLTVEQLRGVLLITEKVTGENHLI